MLVIKTTFSDQYVEALTIVFTEQKKTWEYFCENVPMFKRVNCEKDILPIAKEIHNNYIDMIKSSKNKYKKWWSEEKYNVTKILNESFQYKITGNVSAYVCITPLFTRNVNTRCFLLPTNATKKRFYNIVIHELIHFYYYGKINDLALDLDGKTVWKISELIIHPMIKYLFPDYIYNNNPYNFNGELMLLADKNVKQFIDGKIEFTELIRRLM